MFRVCPDKRKKNSCQVTYDFLLLVYLIILQKQIISRALKSDPERVVLFTGYQNIIIIRICFVEQGDKQTMVFGAMVNL